MEIIMSATLYGVGVGPGDPDLITIKAYKTICHAHTIAIPSAKDNCMAYKIARQLLPEIEQKYILEIPMPMTKDTKLLDESHKKGMELIVEELQNNHDVAFLTLGDPTIYSTYLYLHKLVKELGYSTSIINGVPSFCAAAASLNMGLAEKDESLIIIPSSYPLETLLTQKGTKVLMKSGKKLPQVKKTLKHNSLQVSMVENCGMDNELHYHSLEDIPDNAGYYSLIIAKEDAADT